MEMRNRTPGLAPCLAVGAALFASGCGLSTPRADAKRAELFAHNRARAAPAMRAAAEARGAVLLPDGVREMELPPPCDWATNALPPPDVVKAENPCLGSPEALKACVTSTDRGRSFILRRADGPAQLIVPIYASGNDWRYVRLARRGDTLLILRPEIVSQRSVGSVRRCSCAAGEVFECRPHVKVFVFDVVFAPKFEEVTVPMIEDTFDWSCKVRLL